MHANNTTKYCKLNLQTNRTNALIYCLSKYCSWKYCSSHSCNKERRQINKLYNATHQYLDVDLVLRKNVSNYTRLNFYWMMCVNDDNDVHDDDTIHDIMLLLIHHNYLRRLRCHLSLLSFVVVVFIVIIYLFIYPLWALGFFFKSHYVTLLFCFLSNFNFYWSYTN